MSTLSIAVCLGRLMGWPGEGVTCSNFEGGSDKEGRQVRGSSVNQVPGDGPVLVTAGTGVPTSGLILGPD
jgi:hypothetical protein